jgi:hypothetical protein
MSLPLVDLRAKIHPDTHVALRIAARERDIDISELAREILDRWANERIHGARLLLDALDRERSVGERGGATYVQPLR